MPTTPGHARGTGKSRTHTPQSRRNPLLEGIASPPPPLPPPSGAEPRAVKRASVSVACSAALGCSVGGGGAVAAAAAESWPRGKAGLRSPSPLRRTNSFNPFDPSGAANGNVADAQLEVAARHRRHAGADEQQRHQAFDAVPAPFTGGRRRAPEAPAPDAHGQTPRSQSRGRAAAPAGHRRSESNPGFSVARMLRDGSEPWEQQQQPTPPATPPYPHGYSAADGPSSRPSTPRKGRGRSVPQGSLQAGACLCVVPQPWEAAAQHHQQQREDGVEVHASPAALCDPNSLAWRRPTSPPPPATAEENAAEVQAYLSRRRRTGRRAAAPAGGEAAAAAAAQSAQRQKTQAVAGLASMLLPVSSAAGSGRRRHAAAGGGEAARACLADVPKAPGSGPHQGKRSAGAPANASTPALLLGPQVAADTRGRRKCGGGGGGGAETPRQLILPAVEAGAVAELRPLRRSFQREAVSGSDPRDAEIVRLRHENSALLSRLRDLVSP